MESPRLNPTPDDTALENLLRRQAPAPLADDGFSRRVLAALPPQARRHGVDGQRRAFLIVGGALTGAVIAVVRNGGDWSFLVPSDLPVEEFAVRLTALLTNPGQMAIPTLAIAASLWLAFAPELRSRLKL